MRIYNEFPPGWWIVFSIVFGLYLLLIILRKGYKRVDELKAQFITVSEAARVFPSFIFVIMSVAIEYIAISTGLWTYFPGNWPIILWFIYLGSGLFAYQMGKFIEEKMKKGRV